MNWFKRKGIFFIPASLIGWLIFAAAFIYAVYMFIDIDSRSHSNSDTIRPFVINCFLLFIAYSAIGFFTHRKVKEE